MRTLFQIAIVVLLVWWVCKWWKHRKQREVAADMKTSADAALGASTRVGSNLGSSPSIPSPPTSLGYGQANGAPTGGPPLTNAPTSSSASGSSIFSGRCC
jgi:hypothetical protein